MRVGGIGTRAGPYARVTETLLHETEVRVARLWGFGIDARAGFHIAPNGPLVLGKIHRPGDEYSPIACAPNAEVFASDFFNSIDPRQSGMVQRAMKAWYRFPAIAPVA
jgi:hypothetical protein